MKTIDQIRVSFYKNVYSKSPEKVSLLQVLEAIIKGTHAGKINTIRRYHAEGRGQDAQKLKSGLECFTASGTFVGAHAIRNLEQHSGILLADYDHVPNIEEVRRLCAEDPHTVATFRSPTDGLKIAAYVDNADGRHREAYALVSEYYNRLTGLQCDPACKDESRLCYVSYDPQGYIAVLYEAFHLPDEALVIPAKPADVPQTPAEATDMPGFISSYLFLNPATSGNRHSVLFKLACEACRRGYDENTLYGDIRGRMIAEDFTDKEIYSTLSCGYKYIKQQRESGSTSLHSPFESAKVTKCRYDPIANELTDEEAYWQGEELRKNTPCFPGKVYENIPEMLRDCLLDDSPPREKDLSLLSCLTSFSAMLPQTWGMYDHRTFSPHLYAMGIAPAGSGKGVAQLGGKLLEYINKQTLDESENLLDKYKVQRSEWQAECALKMKNKEPINSKNEPKEPPYKCFIIPATTSNTRMQMQLRDNGNLGGIIFDTEAQTLSNANKLDCGHFDDMLCKAFGHELISSSYKANGMKPIIIHRPQLAVFLTGTPEQLNHFIENPENGLPSRFLFYTYREAPLWKQMGDDTYNIDETFERLSQGAYQLYLFCRNHPLRFTFSRKQWERLNSTFGKLLAEVVTESNDNLQAVVKRHAFIVMRIAMTLSRLEQFESQSSQAECTCSDTVFQTALCIVLCCYEHSRLLFTSIPVSKHHPLQDPDRKRNLFDELPQSFSTEDVVNLAVNYLFSRRTAMRFINQLIGLKINKIGHGKFKKL